MVASVESQRLTKDVWNWSQVLRLRASIVEVTKVDGFVVGRHILHDLLWCHCLVKDLGRLEETDVCYQYYSRVPNCRGRLLARGVGKVRIF